MGTETIGQRIKKYRLAKGLTHRDVASRLGLTLPRISQMERENDITVGRARILATMFGVDVNDLLGTKK